MTHASLVANTRTTLGNSVRKIRKDGLLPAVIYSKSVSPIALQLPLGEFIKVFKTAGKTHVIDLKIDTKKAVPCIVQELDVDPVSGGLRHVDFLAVNLKEKVVASVPVTIVGEAPAVKELDGVLTTPVQELDVEALPDSIPSEIVVDVSTLVSFDDVIRVENLPVSETYTIKEDPDTVLASITAQTQEVEEAPVAEVTPEEGAVEAEKTEETAE